MVADAIVKLIGTEKGKRPLCTVVDPITRKYIQAANEAVAAQFGSGLTQKAIYKDAIFFKSSIKKFEN